MYLILLKPGVYPPHSLLISIWGFVFTNLLALSSSNNSSQSEFTLSDSEDCINGPFTNLPTHLAYDASTNGYHRRFYPSAMAVSHLVHRSRDWHILHRPRMEMLNLSQNRIENVTGLPSLTSLIAFNVGMCSESRSTFPWFLSARVYWLAFDILQITTYCQAWRQTKACPSYGFWEWVVIDYSSWTSQPSQTFARYMRITIQ